MIDLLKVVGEPVAKRIAKGTAVDWWWEKTDCPVETTLYTESQLQAAYAKGQEDMRKRAANAVCNNFRFDKEYGTFHRIDPYDAIRALPIEGEHRETDASS